MNEKTREKRLKPFKNEMNKKLLPVKCAFEIILCWCANNYDNSCFSRRTSRLLDVQADEFFFAAMKIILRSEFFRRRLKSLDYVKKKLNHFFSKRSFRKN